MHRHHCGGKERERFLALGVVHGLLHHRCGVDSFGGGISSGQVVRLAVWQRHGGVVKQPKRCDESAGMRRWNRRNRNALI